MNKIKNISIIVIFTLVCSCAVFAASSKPFVKIPNFNWILTDSVYSEEGIINTYIDKNNAKKIENYNIYWEKFEKSSGDKLIAKYAIDCNRKIRTLMGGLHYNVNGYLILNIEGYNKTNFKSAPEWENVNILSDKTAQNVCIDK